jgi:hypothetical protein
MAQVLIAIGFTYCSMIASGATSRCPRRSTTGAARCAAPHDAADAERVGDGLAQAELLGHLEIGDGAGLVAADLEADDDEIGPGPARARWSV